MLLPTGPRLELQNIRKIRWGMPIAGSELESDKEYCTVYSTHASNKLNWRKPRLNFLGQNLNDLVWNVDYSTMKQRQKQPKMAHDWK